MELFNIICGVCSIAGLLVSVFTGGKVVVWIVGGLSLELRL